MASDPILTQLNHMVTAMKARITPTELKAHEAFRLLSWDEKMTIMQANQRAIEQAIGQEQKEEPQQKRKRNAKTRQQYKRKALQQANVENIAEKSSDSSKAATVNIDSNIVNISLLSTIPRHNVRFSKTSVQIPPIILLTSLVSICQHVDIPPYIRQAEDMEATGQG